MNIDCIKKIKVIVFISRVKMQKEHELSDFYSKQRGNSTIKNYMICTNKKYFSKSMCKTFFMTLCFMILAINSNLCLCAEDEGKILFGPNIILSSK